MSNSDKTDFLRRERLVQIAGQLAFDDANEAQTRKALIDTVLYEVLGWSRDDVAVEVHTIEDKRSEFLDYYYHTAQTHILVEAKRIGVSLDPNLLPPTTRTTLKGKWMDSKVGAAITQARDYARSKGAGFSIVTNGDYWLIFPVNRRDGVSFADSFCAIFRDAQSALIDDYEIFYSLISRERIIDGALEQSFLGGDKDQTDVRRLSMIYDASFSKIQKESVFSHIESAVVTAFSDDLINSNPDLLEKSYVQTPERIRFDSRINMHIQKRETVLSRTPIKALGKGGSKDVLVKITAKNARTRPIALLTLGLVGSGKTTFLNFVAKVSAKSHFTYDPAQASSHWIYVDFRDFTSDQAAREKITDTAFDYINRHEFLRSYDRCLKHAYHDEIDALKHGPLALFSDDPQRIKAEVTNLIMEDYKGRQNYVRKVLSYAASQSAVFLVVDNVDQIEDPIQQSRIFLNSLATARVLKCNLVLAMRDSTYVKNRHSPVFDAFDFDTVYIDAPNILEVLSKRFNIAAQILDGNGFEFETENGVKIPVDNSRHIIEWLKSAILGTEVGHLIEVAATGDTRLALQMTRQFLQYGYSSSTRAIETLQQQGSYRLPPHEALRAIMFGNQSIYKDEYSSIANPFDAKLNRSDCQFLRLYIASSLVNLAADHKFSGIEAFEIVRTLEKIGFSERITETVIKDLMSRRYIYSRSHQDYSRESVLVASRMAGYIIRELIGKFIFLETAMYDTFISDPDDWVFIRDNTRRVYEEKDRVRRFAHRKRGTDRFFLFCEREMGRLVAEAQRRGLPNQWLINPLSRVSGAYAEDSERALRSATRTYSTAAA